MLLGAILILGILSVPLTGGRLGRIAELSFRRPWAIVAALLTQVVIIELVPDGAPALHRTVHLATYGLAALFILSNLRLPGVGVMGLGGGLNALAIAANHGVMPAREGALRTAGLWPPPEGFQSSTVVGHPKLAFLGDVFATPASLPLANVFSVGDVLLVGAAIASLHALSGSRPATWLGYALDALRPKRLRLRLHTVELVELDAEGRALLRVTGLGSASSRPMLCVGGQVIHALNAPPAPGRVVQAGFPLPEDAATLADSPMMVRWDAHAFSLPAARRLRRRPVASPRATLK
jgi:hypothetical protein